MGHNGVKSTDREERYAIMDEETSEHDEFGVLQSEFLRERVANEDLLVGGSDGGAIGGHGALAQRDRRPG